ncbi:MAG: L-threonylcarbamoyladenylate synthase [Terrimicrobiaceae bacterium]|nr:L-threonylcarbamoyladenylate synthase [Terrimicrobiaceae bacterium]
MKTAILPTSDDAALATAVERAADALVAGEPVALPTETVYGLAADALNPLACARVFEAKERPLSDPLIVHLPDLDWLDRLAQSNVVALRLAERFWPGPLTLVLPRRSVVPDLVTAGQGTVAVRMSAHPVFRAVALAAGTPLAAPSANRFGRISPTTAEHVLAELDGRIGLVVDGGPCLHGIESTIALVGADRIAILRHGPIPAEELAEFAPLNGSGRGGVTAPGSLKSHYAPATPLDIVEDLSGASRENSGLLAWHPVSDEAGFASIEVLSQTGDLREVAANLYAGMRRLDARGLNRILALSMPGEGLGAAIMERLQKAAARG